MGGFVGVWFGIWWSRRFALGQLERGGASGFDGLQSRMQKTVYASTFPANVPSLDI